MRRIRTLLLSASATLAAAPLLAQEWSDPVTLPGDLGIGPAAGEQMVPDLAAGDGQYLLVWEDGRTELGGFIDMGGQTSQTDIYAARLDASGVVMDTTPIVVNQDPFDQRRPRVAWNGENYLVIWESEHLTTFWHSRGVYAARVTPDGEVLDDPPILIDDTDDIEELPEDVASNGDGWAVIWKDYDEAAFTDVVQGCIVAPDGTPGAEQRVFTPSHFLYSAWNSRLEWAGDRYLATWSYWDGSDQIAGLLLDANLQPTGSDFDICTDGWDQVLPDVASNGLGFYVVWQDERSSGKVYGTPVSTTGSVAVRNGANLAGGQYPIWPTPSVTWDGSNWTSLWIDWSWPAGSSLMATQADANGQVVNGPRQIDAQSSLGLPRTSSLGAGTLAVWEDGRNGTGRDLFRTTLTTGGQAGAIDAATVSPPAQTHPDIAGELDLRLVVYASRHEGDWRVLATRVDSFGNALDAQPIVVAQASGDLWDPAVAWNGELWLVAWEDTSAGSTSGARVFGRRIDADGNLVDASAFEIVEGNDPDLAALDGDFLVAASHEPVNHQRYLYARRVDGASGAVLDGSSLFVGNSYAQAPSVGAFSDRWLVAWHRRGTHDSPYTDVYVNFVMSNGSVGSEFVVSGATSTATDRSPSVAVEGGSSLITWTDGADVLAGRVLSDGTLVDGGDGFFLSTAPNGQFAPAVAWNDVAYQSAWTDWRLHPSLEPGLGDLYASRVSADGVVLDPGGSLMSGDPEVPEGSTALSGDRGTTLAAYTALHDEAPYGTWRIALRWTGPRLEQSALVRGQPATFTVSGAQSGEAVVFGYSMSGTGAGPCFPQLGDLCLDLLSPVTEIGQATAGATGTASLTVTVPPNAPLVPVWTQAVVLRGATSGKTETVSDTIQ